MTTDSAAEDGIADRPKPPRAARSLGRFVTLGAVSSLVTFAASVARNKALAVTVGPEGIGILGEAAQIASLATTFVVLAGGPVLGGAVASAAREGVEGRARTALTTSLVLGLGLGLVGALVCVVSAPAITGSGWPISTRFAVGIAAGGALVAVVPTMLTAAMGALEDTLGTTLAALFSSFAGSALTVWLALQFGLVGALWSLVVASLATLATTGFFAWRDRRRRASLLPRFAWDAKHARLCVALGVAGLFGSLAQQASLVSIRSALERVGGPTEGAVLNGQFQAAFGLEAQLFAFGMAGLFAYYWPQFGTSRGPEETTAQLDRVTGFVLRTFPPLVLAAVLVRRELITLLFSDRFHVATDILVWYLAAAIPKALLYTYGAPLYFAGKPVRFAMLGVLGFGSLGVVSVAGALRFGIIGVGIGQLVGVLLHLGLAMAFTRATMPVRLRSSRALVSVAFALLVLLVDYATREQRAVRWSLFAAMLVWAYANAVSRRRGAREAERLR